MSASPPTYIAGDQEVRTALRQTLYVQFKVRGNDVYEKAMGTCVSATKPPQNPEPKVRVRWGLIAGVTVLGLLVTAAPFALVWWQGDDFGEWKSLPSSTLTNVGTAILLVAVFWFLERRFTEHIRSEVRETARATAVEETRELAASQSSLSRRLDDIQERLDSRVSEERQMQDQVVHRLDDEISFQAVHAALSLAQELGAIWHDELTVPVGNGTPNLPRFVFRLSASAAIPLHRVRSDDELTPLIDVAYMSPGPITRPVAVHWGAETEADAVLDELRRNLTAAGLADQAAHVDVSLFSNLRTALGEAIAGRRKDPDAWLKGALSEWVNAEWAVTGYGLEHRGHLGMRDEEFPVHWNGRSNAESRMWKPPAPPDGVDSEFWTFLISRARRVHRPGVPFPK